MSVEVAYPRRLRILHWVMALSLPVQGVLGWVAEVAEAPRLAALSMQAHAQFGLLLLLLLAWRFALRRRMPRAALRSGRGLAPRVAIVVHRVLYLLMVVLPLSGAVIFVHMIEPLDVLGLLSLPPLLSRVPEDETLRALAWYLHVYGAWILLAAASLHAAAALWHHYVAGDRLISRRMGLGAE